MEEGKPLSVRVVDAILGVATVYGLGFGMIGATTGLFVGPHVLIPAVAHLIVGGIALVVFNRRQSHKCAP